MAFRDKSLGEDDITGSRLIFYVAILVASLISTTTRALAQETEVIAGGELEYQNHCAICHGVDGKGHGIMTKFLIFSLGSDPDRKEKRRQIFVLAGLSRH